MVNLYGLWAVLNTGYLADDAINSNVSGVLEYHNQSLMDLTLQFMGNWISKEGRFFPFAFYVYSLFATVHSLLVYKILQLTFAILSFYVFSRLVFRLTRDRNLGTIVFLSLSVFAQFRAYYDPILSFHFLLPLVLLLLSGSLLFLLRFLDSGGRWRLVLSVGLYCIACFTYEISLPFLLVFLWITWSRKKKLGPTLVSAAAHLVVFAVTVSLFVVLRLHASNIDPTYQFSFDFQKYARSFLNHVLSSFPLTYYWIAGHSGDTVPALLWGASWLTYVVAGIGGLVLYLSLERSSTVLPRGLWVLGTLFLVLPFVLIALSVKHQGLVLGVAYLPVFVGYAGASVVLLWMGLGLLRWARAGWIRRCLMGFFSVLFALVFVINYHSNERVVHGYGFMLFPRVLFGEALEAGLLASVPNGSTLVFTSRNAWDDEAFVMMHSHQRIIPLYWDQPDFSPDRLNALDPTRRIFVLRYDSHGFGQGSVAVAEISRAALASKARKDTALPFSTMVVYHARQQGTDSPGFLTTRKLTPPEDGFLQLPLE